MRAIVVGASGFGRIHVRELLRSGIQSLDIVGSTCESAQITARQLSEIYQLEIAGFDSFDSALESACDVVSICVPAHLHAHYLEKLAALDCGVLCEKPFIWSANQTILNLERQLLNLAGLQGRLSVNYCNSYYMRQALALMPQNEIIETVSLCFHTNGQHRNSDIGIDLLPHALSALQQITNVENISSVDIRCSHNKYQCYFFADKIQCHFEFEQSADINKRFSIRLNDRNFVRDARIVGGIYETGLLDQKSNVRFDMIDPTRQLISSFVQAIRSGLAPPMDFRFAAKNTLLMHEIINHGK